MMACGACGASGFRVRAEDTRTVFTCRSCGAVSAKQQTAPVRANDEDGDDGDMAPVIAKRAQKPQAQKPSTSKPIDVLKLARARLREVERELRTKRKLEAERDELKRIISAAEGKPGVVRSIRTAV
jgi:hypothetical protein